MRFAMIERGEGAVPAVAMPGGGYLDLPASGLPWRDIEGIIEAGDEGLAAAREAVKRAQGPVSAGSGGGAAEAQGPVIRDAKLLCPLSRPEKILCIGKNYSDHCRELGSPLPDRPVLFAKYRNTLSGPGGEVELPVVSGMIDYEAELAVVIGRRCKQVTPEGALRGIFGYACANDLTMRDAQTADGQWTRAKSPDGFCPLGPWIVTADEIPYSGSTPDLGIRLLLNGEVMQDSRTSRMVFGVAELVSFLSQTMTLEPGDLLLTGTPPGVGMGRKPPVYLRSGDRTVVEIERVGSLETRMR